MASQSFDPSQQQPYQYDYQQQQQQHQQQPHQFNQSSYYPYQPQYYQQPQSSYPYYANQPIQDSSIYPPGVPVPELQNQNQQNGYYYHYPNGGTGAVPSSNEPYVQPPQSVQAANSVANGTGQSFSEHATPLPQGFAPVPVPASQVIQPSYGSISGISNKRAKPNVKPKGRKMKSQPCQPAYCELCKVDCNSLEIFEQHKNGKKHQKNLKAHNEALNKVTVEGQAVKAANFEHKPEVQSHVGVSTVEQMAIGADSSEGSAALKRKKTSLEAGGNGLKRKMKNGKEVKWMRSDDGSKRPVEPVKPKVVPLVCELCNVKCESPTVFQAHLTGKKHLANLKRFHGEQAIVGQAAVEALYPALQVWYPALQALFKGDMSTLISELQQQGYLGVQAQPGPSNHLQGEGSEAPPAATPSSEIPNSSVVPQQQAVLPPEDLATSSQMVVSTEFEVNEQSNPEPAQMVVSTEFEVSEQSNPEPVATRDAESEVVENK